MRRNATKVAAAVLTLAVTMTSVNIPTTAAAATKKVKLNTTKKTLTVGTTLKLTLKEGKKKVKATKVKFTSSKKAIATVTKYGNVKAKKKGTATITATYKKKKYKCKITVKKKVTPAKPTTAPTQAPTQEPTTAPTQEPTTAPTTEPTTAPTDAPTTAPTDSPATVGTITVKGFSASGYKKLKVEFEAAVPEASKKSVEDSIKILRNKAAFTGTPKWAAGDTAIEFESASALPEGEYTLTVNGEEKGKATVAAEYVKDIIIDQDKKVLTGTSSASKLQGRSNDEAYIYYDVVNQYDESIRHRVTINWSVTSCDTNKERSNRALGLVVAQRKNDREIFTYGSTLHVTGTCITGSQKKSKEFVLTIGQQQAVDKVEILGTVDRRTVEDTTIDMDYVKKDAIDEDFTKNTHALLYQVKDQNGNYIEASRNNLGSATENAKFVLRSKNPELVEDKFADGGIFTVNDKNDPEKEKYSEYCSANIEPGRYVDKGGEVEFNYITTGTAGQDIKKLTIKDVPRLASFKIETPSFVVADGDSNIKLDYTAIDTNGNNVTDYKTIARSSNYINFTASDGKLELIENDKGEADLIWTDAERYRMKVDANGNGISGYFNPYNKDYNNNIVINDGIDRAVSLTATVDGATPSQTILSVADMRRPELVSNVKYGYDDNDMVIGQKTGTGQDISISTGIEYTDQYGVKLTEDRAKDFWNAASVDKIPGCQYAVRVKNLSPRDIVKPITHHVQNGHVWSYNVTSGQAIDSINYTTYQDYDYGYGLSASDDVKIKHETDLKSSDIEEYAVAYSVIRRDATSSATIAGEYNKYQWYELGKARTENYTIVPLKMVSDFNIESKSKFGIKDALTDMEDGSYNNNNGNANIGDGNIIYYNGNEYNLNESVTTAGAINIIYGKDRKINVKSRYRGDILTVPNEYYSSVPESDIIVDMNADGTAKEISKVRQGVLKWRDLYNVNSAKYTRKYAELELKLAINKGTGDNDVALLMRKVKISDAKPMAVEITVDNRQSLKKPKFTKISGANLVNAGLLDQYGDPISYSSGHDFIYTISNYQENEKKDAPDNDTRYMKNYKIINNTSSDAYIEGVERNDKYDVKVELSNSGLTPKTMTIIAGSDEAAKITSNIGILNSDEYELRYKYLGYNR